MVIPNESKKGSKCCGQCCDMRRAVIIINIINIILGVVTIAVNVSNAAFLTIGIEDDRIKDDFDSVLTDGIIIASVGLAVFIITLWGAMKYNIFAVGLGALYICAAFVANTVLTIQFFNSYMVPVPTPTLVVSGVISALFLYPHVGLILELNNGIMTPETYPREEMSCCCV